MWTLVLLVFTLLVSVAGVVALGYLFFSDRERTRDDERVST